MTKLHLTVSAIGNETDAIRRITLASHDGGALPGFEPGAHLTLEVPGVGLRKYSLINASSDGSATSTPRTYVLGIRHEPNGEGGSRHMHALRVGDAVHAEPPQNNFPLKPGTEPVVLVGGGIGITPLISMAAALKASGRPFRIVYAARSRAELAFMAELGAIAGDGLQVHTDDTAGRVFDMAACFGALAPGTKVYMCGPKPMLKSGMDAAKALKWPRDRLAFELFYSVAAPAPTPAPAAAPQPAPVQAPTQAPVAEPAPAAGGAFEVVLKNSGQSFRIPPDKSILDVLIDAGVDPIHDCKRGECGVCLVGVIDGIPDHKDHILSDSEKAANKTMQICVSRSKTPKLVLDL